MIHRRSRPTVEERSKKATPNAVGVAHYAPLGAAGIMALIGPFCKPHVQRGVMIAVMRVCGRFRTSEPLANPFFFPGRFAPVLGDIMNGFIALCWSCDQKSIKCAASPIPLPIAHTYIVKDVAVMLNIMRTPAYVLIKEGPPKPHVLIRQFIFFKSRLMTGWRSCSCSVGR